MLVFVVFLSWFWVRVYYSCDFSCWFFFVCLFLLLCVLWGRVLVLRGRIGFLWSCCLFRLLLLSLVLVLFFSPLRRFVIVALFSYNFLSVCEGTTISLFVVLSSFLISLHRSSLSFLVTHSLLCILWSPLARILPGWRLVLGRRVLSFRGVFWRCWGIVRFLLASLFSRTSLSSLSRVRAAMSAYSTEIVWKSRQPWSGMT